MVRTLLFFASPVWAAWWLPLMLAAADVQGEEGCSPRLCGNVAISFPFEVAPEQAEVAKCGRLGFQVTCANNTPYLGYYRRKHWFQILDIFYDNASLLVVDIHKLGDFDTSSHKYCHVPTINSSSKLGPPFSISPANQNLFFYNCTKAPAEWHHRGLVETECRNRTFVRVGGRYNETGNYDGYALEGCNATFLPVLGASGKVNTSNYEQLMSDGFLLTWQQHADIESDDSHGRHNIRLILIASLTPTTGLVFTCLVWILHRRKKKLSLFIHQKHTGNESNTEEVLKRYQYLTPKRYTYSELKKITGCFKEKLGEGGYGMVFKGSLQDGRMVAVKLLKESKGNGEEFLNEVTSIGRTSHVNIVNLLGFCLQGSERALVYEYMANGSLDRYIYSENSKSAIGWESLKQIAIGTARGLEYLHQGCSTRIIHFDIKPHNVLLDEEFCPKIADFGLAKLCQVKDSVLSVAEARGTIGFIAPEVFSRGFGVVSTKSDVYSYGMMLLEMVGGRENVKKNTENSGEAYLPNWIYDHLVEELQSHEVASETQEIARNMTLVGLWCIQTTPGHRPSMSRVIEMLERSVDELEMPPKPFLTSSSLPPKFSS